VMKTEKSINITLKLNKLHFPSNFYSLLSQNGDEFSYTDREEGSL